MVQELLMKMNIVSPIFYKVLYMTIIGSVVGLIIYFIRNILDNKLSGKWKCIMWLIVLIALLVPIRYEVNVKYQFSDNNLINKVDNIKYIGDAEFSFSDWNTRESSMKSEEILENENNFNQNNNSEIFQKDISNVDLLNKDLLESTDISIKEKTMDISNDLLLKDNNQFSSENNTGLQVQEDKSFINNITFKKILINIIIPYIWIIGNITFIITLILSMKKMNKKNIKCVYENERIQKILNECKDKLHINKNIKIILQEYKRVPSISGIFTPSILITKETIEESDETIKYIFLHELAHYKRKDILFNYLLLFVVSIHWFNPIVWFIFNKIRQDIEIGADELAIKNFDKEEKKQYGLVLIELLRANSVENYTANLLCMSDTEKNMERRIHMIKGKSKNVLISAIVVIIVIGILAGMVFVKFTNKESNLSVVGEPENKLESYEKIWVEPNKFESYEECKEYNEYENPYGEEGVNPKLTEEDKLKLISEEEAKQKAEQILNDLGIENANINKIDAHKNYVEGAKYVYIVEDTKKELQVWLNGETGKFLRFYDDGLVRNHLEENEIDFEEAKRYANEIYSKITFLESQYEFYNLQTMRYANGGIGSLSLWEVKFAEKLDSGILNPYKILIVNFFVNNGNVYLHFSREMDLLGEDKYSFVGSIDNIDIQDNPIIITKEDAIKIATEKFENITGRKVGNKSAFLTKSTMNEYVWLQEKSNGTDNGREEVQLYDEENNPNGSTTYQKYYYPENIIRNVYFVKMYYEDGYYDNHDDFYDYNLGKIFYVDATSGEILGGKALQSDSIYMSGESEIRKNKNTGEESILQKKINYIDMFTGEKVGETIYPDELYSEYY